MTPTDRFLLKHGFNLDGSKMSKRKMKRVKEIKKHRVLRVELVIADKKSYKTLQVIRQTQLDARGKNYSEGTATHSKRFKNATS